MSDDAYYAVIDKESDEVEKLLWMSDQGGYFREDGEWTPLDHDSDEDEFEGTWVLDVKPSIVKVYDGLADSGKDIQVQDISDYALSKGDLDGIQLYGEADPEPVTASGLGEEDGEAPQYAGLTWEETIQP